MSLFTCQVSTGETLPSRLRESFLQPSQICGFLILRQDSRNTMSEWTSPLTAPALVLSPVYFYPGGTWPESNGPSQCGTTPTPAAWRCWTTRSRSKEAWRAWRTSWRRWPMPSPFCPDDDSCHCRCATLLLFASCPDVLRNLCQGWYVPLPVLLPHLQCANPRITALVDAGC